MKFIVDLTCPDGDFIKEEVEEMITDWLDKKRKEGIAFRLLYSVKKRIKE